ncbi:MAG: LamG domain-containing protein [Planctomycetes bacterium]|nr:LamG domain-containing protein [Planctomycetota bacterium]
MNQSLASFSLALTLLPALAAQNLGIALSATVDGYVDVPYSSQVVPQSGITVEAWITYDDATLPTGWRYPTVLRQGHTTGGSEDYFLRVEAGNTGARTLRWKVVDQNNTNFAVNWPFATGQLLTWTHVACTYDGVTAAMYVNGTQVGSVAANGLPIRDLNSESLRIGKGSDVATPIEVWNGEIDEVRLWPFARTQAEIAQTMSYQLAGVPGLVSTWSLDGHLLDLSGNQHATSSGQVTFTPNTLNLTQLSAASGTAVGASTPGCLGPIEMSFGSLPQAGNLDFGPVCTRVPGNAITFLAMALNAAPVPLHIAGIDFWLDSSTSLAVLASANGLGAARFTVPMPAWLPNGTSLAFQYGIVDPCGPQGLTASNALVTLTQ